MQVFRYCVSTADWYYKMYYYSMVGVRVVGTDYKALPKMQVLLPNEWYSIRYWVSAPVNNQGYPRRWQIPTLRLPTEP